MNINLSQEIIDLKNDIEIFEDKQIKTLNEMYGTMAELEKQIYKLKKKK